MEVKWKRNTKVPSSCNTLLVDGQAWGAVVKNAKDSDIGYRYPDQGSAEWQYIGLVSSEPIAAVLQALDCTTYYSVKDGKTRIERAIEQLVIE